MEGDVLQVQGTRVGDGSKLRQGHTYNAPVTIHHAAKAEAVPGSVYDVPDLLSQHFVGRADGLAKIKDALSKAHSDSPARCVIYGMPGLGKTQLALKYADSVYEERQVNYIFWMSAASSEKLVQGFSRLLDLIAFPGRQELDQQARSLVARRWLENESAEANRDWLLILDNVSQETTKELWEMLPRRNGSGRILFTTRTQPVAETLATAFQKQHSCVELAAPDVDEAVDLFTKVSGLKVGETGEAQEETRELVKLVGCLPLAVDQAASFLEVSKTPMSKVVEIYKSDKLSDALEWQNELSRYSEKSVMATYTFAIDELQQSPPGLMNLLQTMVFLDPEYIPLGLLKEGCIDRAAPAAIITLPSAETPEKQSKKTSEQRERGFRASLRAFRKRHERKTSKDSATNHREINENKAEDHQTNHQTERPNEPTGRLEELMDNEPNLQRALQFGQRLSLIQILDGGDRKAIRIHDLVHRILRKKLMIDEKETQSWLLETLSIISNAFKRSVSEPRNQDTWAKCVEILPHVQALQSHVEECGVNNLEFLKTCKAMQTYLAAQGRYEEALHFNEQILVQSKKLLGEVHLQTIECAIRVARGYLKRREIVESEKIAREALDNSRKLVDIKNRTLIVVECSSILSETYTFQGRLADAHKLIDEAMEMLNSASETVRGDLDLTRHLASSNKRAGRLEKAAELQERAVKGYTESYGAQDSDTIHLLDNLSIIYLQLGRLEEAEAKGVQVVELAKQLWGPEHRQIADYTDNLAMVYGRQKRWDEAIAAMEEALRLHTSFRGADDPRTQRAARNLASLRRKRDRAPEETVARQSKLSDKSPDGKN